MGIINYRKYVSTAILLAFAIPFQASAGQMTTIKAIAGADYFTDSSGQHKNIYVVMNSPISCSGASSTTVRFEGVSAMFVISGGPGALSVADPWFENYSLLLTAAQNNLSIEINQTIAPYNASGYCVVSAPTASNPTPYLIHFQ